ncbi:MAG: hypothetical protein KJZ84_07310 [Bryobacteraceae bacterium]|nr:hypothetical protein [Bryobacteraceae bacterium]
MKAGVHRVLIIGLDQALSNSLKRDLLGVSSSLTAIELPASADRQDLELALTLDAPTAVLLETTELEASLPIARWLREKDHNLQTVGFSREIGTEALLQLMRAGIREWLPVPASAEALLSLLERIQAEAANHPPLSWSHGQLITFLPAKPGSGASTVALHAAQECARITGNRALLLDLDLQCGTLGFATKAAGGLNISEALLHAHQLDAALWARLVARKGELDIIPSGASPVTANMDPSHVRRVFGFAVGRYPFVLADLPGGLEPAVILTMEQSFRIFMVCTTDLSSIHLARRKLDLCRSLGIADKVEIIVNRATFHFGLNQKGLVEILGKAPIALLPNTFIPLQIALKDGTLLDADSPFVEALSPVIRSITGIHEDAAPARRKTPAISVSRTLQHLRSVVSSLRGNGVNPTPDESSLARLAEAAGLPAPSEETQLAASTPDTPPGRPGDRRRASGDRRRKKKTQGAKVLEQPDESPTDLR